MTTPMFNWDKEWHGFWYFLQNEATLQIVTTPPEQFLQWLHERNEPEPTLPFLFACAVFDLHWNGMSEQATKYLEYAKVSWPHKKWDEVLGMILAEFPEHTPIDRVTEELIRESLTVVYLSPVRIVMLNLSDKSGLGGNGNNGHNGR